MVGEVVVDRDAARLAAPLEATLDPAERPERVAQALGRRAGFRGHGERRERIPHVVLPASGIVKRPRSRPPRNSRKREPWGPVSTSLASQSAPGASPNVSTRQRA
jgi:hypothetical protein